MLSWLSVLFKCSFPSSPQTSDSSRRITHPAKGQGKPFALSCILQCRSLAGSGVKA